MRITKKLLMSHGATCNQVAIFDDEWPEGAEATEANCLRAVELELDLDWAAEHLLPAAAWAEYNRQMAPAWAEIDRQMAAARAELDRQMAPARAEYNRQMAPARAELDRQMAAAFYAATAMGG